MLHSLGVNQVLSTPGFISTFNYRMMHLGIAMKNGQTIRMSTWLLGFLLGVCLTASTSWAQCNATELRKILPDDGDPGDHFGEAISFCPDSCGLMIIGAHVDDDAGGMRVLIYFV